MSSRMAQEAGENDEGIPYKIHDFDLDNGQIMNDDGSLQAPSSFNFKYPVPIAAPQRWRHNNSIAKHYRREQMRMFIDGPYFDVNANALTKSRRAEVQNELITAFGLGTWPPNRDMLEELSLLPVSNRSKEAHDLDIWDDDVVEVRKVAEERIFRQPLFRLSLNQAAVHAPAVQAPPFTFSVQPLDGNLNQVNTMASFQDAAQEQLAVPHEENLGFLGDPQAPYTEEQHQESVPRQSGEQLAVQPQEQWQALAATEGLSQSGLIFPSADINDGFDIDSINVNWGVDSINVGWDVDSINVGEDVDSINIHPNLEFDYDFDNVGEDNGKL